MLTGWISILESGEQKKQKENGLAQNYTESGRPVYFSFPKTRMRAFRRQRARPAHLGECSFLDAVQEGRQGPLSYIAASSWCGSCSNLTSMPFWSWGSSRDVQIICALGVSGRNMGQEFMGVFVAVAGLAGIAAIARPALISTLLAKASTYCPSQATRG